MSIKKQSGLFAKLLGLANGQVFIWVIGSPRSGTTFLTKSLGENTDICLNEPESIPMYRRGNVANWKFPKCRSVVFKWCENYAVAEQIMDKFPNSFFLHTIREPNNNVYSIAHPKADSFPPRPFAKLGQEKEIRIQRAISVWSKYTEGCLNVEKKYPSNYMAVPYQDMPKYFPMIAKKTGVKINSSLDFVNRDLPAEDMSSISTQWQKLPKAEAIMKSAKASISKQQQLLEE